MKNMSENIRNTRIALGLSQSYVAKRLGISQQTYSLLENEPQKFSLQRFTELCRLLNVNPIEVITDELTGPVLLKTSNEQIDLGMAGQLSKQLKSMSKSLSDLKKRIEQLKEKMK